jgi:hypothetical protein
VDEDLFASAQMVGAVMDRSAAQQITHWARIGRELEAAAQVSHRAIAEVLANGARYDDLSEEEQAVVRAEWWHRLEARRAQLDLAKRFAQEERTYVELDERRRVVTREPAKKGHRGA